MYYLRIIPSTDNFPNSRIRYSRQSAKQSMTVFGKFPVMHIRIASVRFSHSRFVARLWFASCSDTDVADGS